MKSLPEGNRTRRVAVSEIALGVNEPSKSLRLIGEIGIVGISLFLTKEESMKESVELESRREENVSTAEVSLDSFIGVNLVISFIYNVRSISERVDALINTPGTVRTWSMRLLLHTRVQEPRTIFLELQL